MARARTVHTVETVEDVRLRLPRNTNARIGDVDDRPAIFAVNRDENFAAGEIIVDTVLDQIAENAGQQRFIAAYYNFSSTGQTQLDTPFAGLMFQARKNL